MLIILDDTDLSVFSHPALDLVTGQLIDLNPEPDPQMDLFPDEPAQNPPQHSPASELDFT
ncbi:hypothetical protein NVV94_05320 [Pseudomonas sp. LS1212]|uniref:hypothetical protein n=1 Tax=Pseudomonas sp. LS1212 TaxID=2972478 RepID=UPI00215BF37E|nr:hypothetical protein [Pseudomonas sp. LS1212]UVJ45004.1 hypothetical protein NVV94_05320 [Pseudomonas sp. LS1212]